MISTHNSSYCSDKVHCSFSSLSLYSHFSDYDFRSSLIDIPLVSIVRSTVIFCAYSLCDGPSLSSSFVFDSMSNSSSNGGYVRAMEGSLFSHIPLLLFPTSGQVIPEPLGVVLVFSSWNFPISLSLDPVIGAISAGNAVVLKPSEMAPACCSFLAKTLPLYLDLAAIRVVEGGPDICEKLLQQKWDKIFFTGTPRVRSLVMSTAAKNLTHVTLELGGKSPTIVDTLSNPAHVKAAVKRILGGKFGSCSGQACIGIDYLLVEEKFAPQLIEVLKTYIRRFYGENPIDSKSISRVVNKNHFDRLRNLLKDSRVFDSIVHGGEMDEEKL